MATKRDNFTPKTIDVLGKRVAYVCSNPDCKRTTIGPNEDVSKVTTIGIAAHITAASQNGPRFNSDLNEEQRRHIDNGIWLCSNCATLIDKDYKSFSVELLRKWKNDAEALTYSVLIRENQGEHVGLPFLEADIIWTHGGRWNRGYSQKNKTVIVVGQDLPIIKWELDWNYTITLYNNSRFDAFNVKIESIGKVNFDELSKLDRYNFLPALKNIDVSAKFSEKLEGTYKEADELIFRRVPHEANGICLKISYFDEARNKVLTTLAKIVDGQFENVRGE